RRAAELSTESLEPDHDSDEDREVTGQAEVETTQQLHHRRRRSSHVSVTRGRILREVFAHPMVDRPFEGLRIRGGWSSADDEQNIGQARDVPLDDRHEQTHHIMASGRSEEHTSELQSRFDLVCRLLLEKKKRCGCRKTNAKDAAGTK